MRITMKDLPIVTVSISIDGKYDKYKYGNDRYV